MAQQPLWHAHMHIDCLLCQASFVTAPCIVHCVLQPESVACTQVEWTHGEDETGDKAYPVVRGPMCALVPLPAADVLTSLQL